LSENIHFLPQKELELPGGVGVLGVRQKKNKEIMYEACLEFPEGRYG